MKGLQDGTSIPYNEQEDRSTNAVYPVAERQHAIALRVDSVCPSGKGGRSMGAPYPARSEPRLNLGSSVAAKRPGLPKDAPARMLPAWA